MAPTHPHREYDLVHLGASGYTGRYVLQHICNHFPTNLKWAVAGRSQSKLERIVEDLEKQFPDRKPPSIEVCQQNDAEMDVLAAKTKVIITTVGPFVKYGEPVLKACANNGTGYVDATGEAAWVKTMIDKYHDVAKKTGAIVIPQCALESAFSDLLAYALTSHIRSKFNATTKSITTVVWNIKMMPSGGTLATVFAMFDLIPTQQLLNAMRPYALSPMPRPAGTYPPRGGLGRFSGMMRVPKLGLAVNSGPIMGVTNAAVVWRTWGLFQQAITSTTPGRKTRSITHSEGLKYGADFHYTEVTKASNRITGFLYHIGISTLMIILAIPPFRWVLRRLVYQPGQGPPEGSTSDDGIEMRALATSAEDSGTPREIIGRARIKASAYDMSGLFLTQAAKVILQIYNEKAGQADVGADECYARREGGGVLTPACLGQAFLDGAKGAGYEIDITEES